MPLTLLLFDMRFKMVQIQKHSPFLAHLAHT